MSVIAVDIGSSRVKAVLADWDGHLLEIRSLPTPRQVGTNGERAYPVLDVHAAVERLVSDLCAAHPGEAVETLTFACLGTAAAPFDKAERPLGPALAPNDARPDSARLDGLLITREDLAWRTGSDPGVGSFLLHAMWWSDAHPEIVERTHRFRSLRGYSLARLCGADAEDRSWASRTMLADLHSGEWDAEICAAAGLAPSLLPPLAPSTATYPLRPAAVVRLGLADRAQAVIGAMDNGCAYLGARGADRSGLVNIVGTYEHMAGVASLSVARELAAPTGAMVHAYVQRARYIALTRVPVGELLAIVAGGDPRSLEAIVAGVASEPTGGSTIRLVPGAVKAALATGTSPRDVAQVVLESSSAVLARFADAWAASGLEDEPIAVVGGAAASDGLLALKARLLGRTLVTLEVAETALLGALRLAAVAVRGTTLAEACRLFDNPVVATVSPAAGAGTRQLPGAT